MVFCAYCGQNFKRKEHLERHLPSHTNVKPYKCDSCQLSFARRDLLQKHHSTYHEAREPVQTPDGEPPISSRTPIACSNCATAKAGCDKKVPCSRCADKNLPCAPRFARRASKGAILRAAVTNGSTALQHQNSTKARESNIAELSTEDRVSDDGAPPGTDSRSDVPMWGSSQKESVEQHEQGLRYSSEAFEMLKAQGGVVRVDDFLGTIGGDFDTQGVSLDDISFWNNGPLDVDMCGNEGIDFPGHTSMFYYSALGLGENLSDVAGVPLPSPSETTSMSHSRTNSSSNIWQARIEPQHQEQIISFLTPNTEVIPEVELVVAAEEGWPFIRCNPRLFSGNCPRTAIAHLQKLQNNSNMEEGWTSLDHLLSLNEPGSADNLLTIVPLLTTTRDKIIAFAQSFLLKALRTHHSGLESGTLRSRSTRSFFTLPPSNVLENLLRSSVRSLSPYYTLIHGITLDPNEPMLDNDTSTLLFLLMMAQGASSVPSSEGRYLAAGLSETCRISLFDVIEKNVELSADPIVLKSAFLLTILCAWGGDAWHIKMAMGAQRGMYLAMLKHGGLLEPQDRMMLSLDEAAGLELRWKEWLRREHTFRLVYNWVMLDQELSLFHDTGPILSITELQTPLPGSEHLWRAENSVEWLNTQRGMYTDSSNPEYHSANFISGMSLSRLFQDLLHDEVDLKTRHLSPLVLKLLLHPLQSLVCHISHLLSCSYGAHDNHSSRALTTASTLLRLEEIQSSLQKWYELCMVHTKRNSDCSITRGSLVLYHLISLNTVTYFPEIERLARRESLNGMTWEAALRSKPLIYQREKAILHCGQIFRHISAMPQAGRPPWWSAAIYRATMILWADSISRTYSLGDTRDNGPQ